MYEAEYGLPILEMIQRLVAACVAGALVGWDRERKNKPAGLRTHMLVTLGSASFCILGFELGSTSSAGGAVDPMRVLQGVVGGIGFLGAGSIIESRGHVRGVTTAAGLWMSGSLGAACGIGAYYLAGLSLALTLFVLIVVGRFERRLIKPGAAASSPSKPPS
ncbi:MAG: MgtC/SapB family protein [Polyangiaceae bacterium]|nr:MgtC/SapB family protein [Polyangiaceae bacterium]